MKHCGIKNAAPSSMMSSKMPIIVTLHIVSEPTQHSLILLEKQSSTSHSTSSEQCLQTYKLNLSGQCVLYVGGLGSLIPHYREIVSNMEGEFVYHMVALKVPIPAYPPRLIR